MQKEEILQNLDFEAFYASELPSLKATNGKGMALCPFHNDTKPSLSVDLKTGHFHCFGCSAKGSVFDFYMRKHGVGFKEAKEALATQAGLLSEPQRKIVKTYNYTDESGNLLYQVVRYEPKGFAQRRPDGNGGWIWNLDGVRRVLYNLPEVIKAEVVFLTEGERDCENLRELGLVGTTNAMGAGKWRTEYNQHLKEKDVVILSDNDPEGKKHALDVAKSLIGVAKSVKLIDLPNLPEKGDISDWTGNQKAEGKDNETIRDSLLNIIGKTPEWQPPKEVALIDQLLKWNDIAMLDVKTEYLLEGLIPSGAITLLFGRGGIGKTWLALQISRTIAEGLPFGNLQTIKTPVYYVDFENPLAVLKERIEKIGKAQNLYIWHISNQISPPRLDSLEWIQYQELPPGLLIFDTLRASHLSDENDSRPIAVIMGRLKELREKGFTILLLHHTPKSNENIFKGSTALLDLADCILGLEEIREFEAVEFDTENLYRLGTRIKTRYAPAQVFLGFNPEKGFEITEDPDIKKMEAIYRILKELNPLPNQRELKEKIKEEFDYTDKQMRKLLKKGENLYWDVKDGLKKSKIYTPKESVSVCHHIYSGHTDILKPATDTQKENNIPQTFNNTGLVSVSKGAYHTDTLDNLFNGLYKETLDKLEQEGAGKISWEELDRRNPEIKQAEDKLNEIWLAGKEGEATLKEFKEALERWEQLMIEGAKKLKRN